jgi:hypothetical protein
MVKRVPSNAAAVAVGQQGVRGDVGKVQHRNADGRLDRRRHAMHRVGADQQAFGPGVFQPACGICKDAASRIPVIGVLQARDLGELDTPQQQPGRVQTAQARGNQLVDALVVVQGGFPAHATDQPDGFHAVQRPNGLKREFSQVLVGPRQRGRSGDTQHWPIRRHSRGPWSLG